MCTFSVETELSACALRLPECVRWRSPSFRASSNLVFVQKQSSNKNKDCMYNSQQWDFNNQQFPTTSQPCCISGILGFELKVKWQVFSIEELYVLRKAQYWFP